MLGGVVHVIAVVRQLGHNTERDGAFSDSLRELIEQEVGAFRSRGFGGQMIDARFRDDPVAAKAAGAIFVGETHRRDSEEPFASEAGGCWFRRLNERERLGMAAEECLQRGSR